MLSYADAGAFRISEASSPKRPSYLRQNKEINDSIYRENEQERERERESIYSRLKIIFRVMLSCFCTDSRATPRLYLLIAADIDNAGVFGAPTGSDYGIKNITRRDDANRYCLNRVEQFRSEF